MKRLGIDTILANTAQAKGRVERYNSTIQNRLIVDIKRFGIKDYDQLNEWFNLESEDIFNFKKICEQQEELINLLITNPFFSKNIK